MEPQAFRAGRNEPCPCGSGRKWKQCHGAPPRAADRPAWDERDRAAALEQLDRFVRRTEFRGHDEAAMTALWGDVWSESTAEQDELLDDLLEDPQVAASCFNHFAIDREREDGRTLLETFLARHGSGLATGERRYLEALANTWVGIYRVAAVEERCIVLHGLWQERTVRVTESEPDLVPGTLLAARLLELPSGGVMVEDAWLFEPEHEGALLARLGQATQDVARDADERTLLRQLTPLWHEAWLELCVEEW